MCMNIPVCWHQQQVDCRAFNFQDLTCPTRSSLTYTPHTRTRASSCTHQCESHAEQSSDKGTCQHVFYHLMVSLLWDLRADGDWMHMQKKTVPGQYRSGAVPQYSTCCCPDLGGSGYFVLQVYVNPTGFGIHIKLIAGVSFFQGLACLGPRPYYRHTRSRAYHHAHLTVSLMLSIPVMGAPATMCFQSLTSCQSGTHLPLNPKP